MPLDTGGSVGPILSEVSTGGSGLGETPILCSSRLPSAGSARVGRLGGRPSTPSCTKNEKPTVSTRGCVRAREAPAGVDEVLNHDPD